MNACPDETLAAATNRPMEAEFAELWANGEGGGWARNDAEMGFESTAGSSGRKPIREAARSPQGHTMLATVNSSRGKAPPHRNRRSVPGAG